MTTPTLNELTRELVHVRAIEAASPKLAAWRMKPLKEHMARLTNAELAIVVGGAILAELSQSPRDVWADGGAV